MSQLRNSLIVNNRFSPLISTEQNCFVRSRLRSTLPLYRLNMLFFAHRSRETGRAAGLGQERGREVEAAESAAPETAARQDFFQMNEFFASIRISTPVMV